MPSAGFEPAIPATKRLQTYVLDRAATGIGNFTLHITKLVLTIIFISMKSVNNIHFYVSVKLMRL
jgi:hypothetical protein